MKKLNSNSQKIIPETLTGIASFVMLSLFMVLFSSCEDDSNNDNSGNSKLFSGTSQQTEKQKDFDSPVEYMENPSIKDAVDESNIEINEGKDFPALIGDYHATGNVTDASLSVSVLIGGQLNSLITLYAQTSWADISDQDSPWGKISFREKVEDITVFGSGGYVTGSDSEFTIWQESSQSGSEAGLPEGITINVALIVSGKKLESGNLIAKGLSTITYAKSNNSNYDASQIIGVWWKWEADCTLIGLPTIN